MTSSNGKQIIPTHILLNTQKSDDNQAMKFSQLIEYKMRNIFLEKSCAKYGGETSSRTFCKKSKLCISLDQQSEILCS